MSNFIEKKSDKSYILHLRIKPNSKMQRITINGKFLTISLRSKPIQNRANKELLDLLKKKLKISLNQIQIISGLKSSNKIIKLEFPIKINEEALIRKFIH